MPFTEISGLFGQTVIRARDGVQIPLDPGNRDYQDYLAWIDAGRPTTWEGTLNEPV